MNLTPMPVIVGSPRSGTTLLRFMLDSHPDLAIPPETRFLSDVAGLSGEGNDLRERFFQTVTNYPNDAPNWPDFHMAKEAFWDRLVQVEPFTTAGGCRAFYQLYASRFEKSRWGDKTPLYCMHMESIQDLLPEAHFIHLIRDGRDVALSLRQMWFSPGWEIETQALHWRDCIMTARQQGKNCRHYLEVRYEDLILDTRATLQRICTFLDLSFAEPMLRYYERTPFRLQEHEGRCSADGKVALTKEQRLDQQKMTTTAPDRTRIFTWKLAMSEDEQSRFEQVAGELLRELGYATSG